MPNDRRAAVRRIVDEFEGVDLGDTRLDERLVKIVEKLAMHPGESLPTALGSDAEIEAAYRFANNARVEVDAVLEPHVAKTAARACAAKKVFVIHDTTSCACPHAEPEDVGYLNTGKAGFYAHYALVVDEPRTPLGVVHLETLARDTPPRKRKDKKRKRNVSGAETRKDEDREFKRWIRGIEAAEEVLKGCELVHLADRETDSFELHAANVAAGRRFVFRMRIEARKAQTLDGEQGSVRELAMRSEGILQRKIQLSARKTNPDLRGSKAHPTRETRLAKLSFSAAEVEIRPPTYLRSTHPEPLRLNVVRVWEAAAPKGTAPVEWLLYTTEPVETPAEVSAVVDAYRARWLIEECNKALKSGCLIEEREFESLHAAQTMLAVSLPIAVEVLALRAASRADSAAPATNVMSPVRLEVLRKMGSRKLSQSPTVREALFAVAAMGGHMKFNGDPGWLVLQRGMERLMDYEAGWRAARDLPEM